MTLAIHPVTPDRWDDLEALFGPRGAYSGCWCMYFRQTAKQFSACAGDANRELFRSIVESGEEPGLLAYRDDEPAGWTAVSPRETFSRVLRSRVIKPQDDRTGVWAIPCFFIGRAHRRRGVGSALLGAAVEFAQQRGATAVEGYPYETDGDMPAAEAYVGTVSMFAAHGFEPVEPVRAPKRRVMRKVLA